MKALKELVVVSQFYGSNHNYVIAGGGNTSFKTEDKLWIKASGTSLETIEEDGFAMLNRNLLNEMANKKYSDDVTEREEQVKNDLSGATITKDKRPSVETSLHNVINYAFVVHLHPTYVNGLMCSNNARKCVVDMFGDDTLYIEYTDPGYVLFKKVDDRIKEYRNRFEKEPQVIWLQNHGIFVAADNIAEIKNIYDNILNKIEQTVSSHFPKEKSEGYNSPSHIGNQIKEWVGRQEGLVAKISNNALIDYFASDIEKQKMIAKPFTPDAIVYCKSNYLFINITPGDNIDEIMLKQWNAFISETGYAPKVILINKAGLITVGKNQNECNTIMSVYEDAMKIAYIAQSFGGPHPMTKEQIDFIDNWEVENYRRKAAR